MTASLQTTLPLRRWQGDRGTYHLVMLEGDEAEAITTHAALHRMEYGKQRGFGSVKVIARVGDTEWKSSVFPMVMDELSPSSCEAVGQQKTWTLLISKKVMRAEDLAEGDPVALELELL